MIRVMQAQDDLNGFSQLLDRVLGEYTENDGSPDSTEVIETIKSIVNITKTLYIAQLTIEEISKDWKGSLDGLG